MPASPTRVARRVAAAVTLAAMLALAPPAAAAPSCAFDALSGRATLTLGPGDAGYLAIGDADAIVVDEAGTSCDGATRLATSVLAVVGSPASVESLVVDLGGGAFAAAGVVPQLSPISVEIDLGSGVGAAGDVVRIVGSAAPEELVASGAPGAVAMFVAVDEGGQPTLRLSVAGAGTQIELVGGAGNDVLQGSPGGDVLEGGAGNDVLAGGLGDDRYRFDSPAGGELDVVVEADGEGHDTLDLAAVGGALAVDLGAPSGVVVEGPGRTVAVSAGGELESLVTGGGPDTVRGSVRADVVASGKGDDVVDVSGGGADVVTCGDGRDIVSADGDDTLASDCERVLGIGAPDAPGAPAPIVQAEVAALPADADPAGASGEAARSRQARRRAPAVSIGGRWLGVTRSGRVAILIRCPSAARGPCRLGVDLAVARPLRLASGRRVHRLGRATRSIPRGRTRVVAVRLAVPVRRAVRKQGDVRVVLSVTVRDGSPGARTTTKRFLLRALRR